MKPHKALDVEAAVEWNDAAALAREVRWLRGQLRDYKAAAEEEARHADELQADLDKWPHADASET